MSWVLPGALGRVFDLDIAGSSCPRSASAPQPRADEVEASELFRWIRIGPDVSDVLKWLKSWDYAQAR